MFTGLASGTPGIDYDTPDRSDDWPTAASEDRETLRALEGHPPAHSEEEQRLWEQRDIHSPIASDAGWEAQQRTFSLDVEARPNSGGLWAAELWSANDSKSSGLKRYRVTGLTMLPTILAAEGFREILASAAVLPLETAMVRVVGIAYQRSAGISTADMYSIFDLKSLVPLAGNIFGTFAAQ